MNIANPVSPHRVGSITRDPIMALVDYSLSKGMSKERIENLIGLPVDFHHPNEMIPAMVGPVLSRAILESEIGKAPTVEIAQAATFGFFGGLENAILLSGTMRQGFEVLIENFVVFHEHLIPALDETRTLARFSFRFLPDEADNGACNEVVLGMIARLIRSTYGEAGRPLEAQVRYAPNGEKAMYEAFFGCPVTFVSEDQSFGLVYSRTRLDDVRQGYDPDLFRYMSRKLRSIADARRRHCHSAELRELTNAALVCANHGLFKTGALASLIGLNERKAQRIAQSHGTSLGQLVLEARLKLLNEQLARDPSICAEQLSCMVGLSDSRSLRRALKSWTGQHLSQLRTLHA
ncbi:MAG: AraC family transcriptional regulator ligand-binding domain-containing protein [Pseudomonadota bacterium]